MVRELSLRMRRKYLALIQVQLALSLIALSMACWTAVTQYKATVAVRSAPYCIPGRTYSIVQLKETLSIMWHLPSYSGWREPLHTP